MSVLCNVYPALSQMLLPSVLQPLGLENCSMDLLYRNKNACTVKPLKQTTSTYWQLPYIEKFYLGSQMFSHTIPLWRYSNFLDRPPPYMDLSWLVLWSVDLERFYCICNHRSNTPPHPTNLTTATMTEWINRYWPLLSTTVHVTPTLSCS